VVEALVLAASVAAFHALSSPDLQMKPITQTLVISAALLAALTTSSAFALPEGVRAADFTTNVLTWWSTPQQTGSYCANRSGCTSSTGNKIAFCHRFERNANGQWVQGQQRWNPAWSRSNRYAALRSC
jgi:hypothetical protein